MTTTIFAQAPELTHLFQETYKSFGLAVAILIVLVVIFGLTAWLVAKWFATNVATPLVNSHIEANKSHVETNQKIAVDMREQTKIMNKQSELLEAINDRDRARDQVLKVLVHSCPLLKPPGDGGG